MTNDTTTEFGQVLADLMASRGIEGLEELVARVNAAGYELTAQELVEWPRPSFGKGLDAVLSLSEEERVRLSEALAQTFFPSKG